MSPRKEQIGPADWWLRNGAWFIAITFLLLSGTFAFADDKSECLDGIKAIKAAVAKKPPKPVLDRLKRALDIAMPAVTGITAHPTLYCFAVAAPSDDGGAVPT